MNNWIEKDGLGSSGSEQDHVGGLFEKGNKPTTCVKGLAFFDHLIDCHVLHEVTWSYIGLELLFCPEDTGRPFLKTTEKSVRDNMKSKPRGEYLPPLKPRVLPPKVHIISINVIIFIIIIIIIVIITIIHCVRDMHHFIAFRRLWSFMKCFKCNLYILIPQSLVVTAGNTTFSDQKILRFCHRVYFCELYGFRNAQRAFLRATLT